MDVDDNGTVHFKLSELEIISHIVNMFDEATSKRIYDIYSYHKIYLHESYNQPLQLSIAEIKRFKKRFIFKACFQPEFIFSDDEDIL